MAAQSCCILAHTCAQSLDVNVPSLRSTRRFSSVATLCTRTMDGSSKPACCHSTSSTSKTVRTIWLVPRATTMSTSPVSRSTALRAQWHRATVASRMQCRQRLSDLAWLSAAPRCCARLVTLASLARGNLVFLQAILFRKPWRYVCNKQLSGYAHRLQLFQGRILVLQQTNLSVVRTHTLAEQANRLQG